MNKKIEYNNGFVLQRDTETLDEINKCEIDKIEITLETRENMDGLFFINGIYVYSNQNEPIADFSKNDNTEFHSFQEIKTFIANETGVDEAKISASVNTPIPHDDL